MPRQKVVGEGKLCYASLMETELSLGKYIRERRERKRLSLLELSNRTGLGYSHLSRIENESTIPSPETIVRIADEIEGDLTVMLQKANNLPRVILDRLLERDKAVRLQRLHREAGGPRTDAENDLDAAFEAVEGLPAGEESRELRQALSGLLALKPHARRGVLQLIEVLAEDDG
jgi:transcriptional regulator with XRE-family HTH domain